MVYVGSIVRNRPKKRPSMSSTRRALFNKHNGICAYCRRQTEMPRLGCHTHNLTATVEHIIPVSRGGGWRGSNITLACSLCNGLKGNMTPHDWTEFMMMNPEWWRAPTRKAVLPIAESQMILREGKKAWTEWKARQYAQSPKTKKAAPLPKE